MSSRLLSNVLGVSPPGLGDEAFVATWVEMMVRAVTG